jgi:hypothetical protein
LPSPSTLSIVDDVACQAGIWIVSAQMLEARRFDP